MLNIKHQVSLAAALSLTLSIYALEASVAAESGNFSQSIIPSVYQDECEYETTNFYIVGGALTVFALERFWSEHDCLQKHSLAHLRETADHCPFCHWQ